MEISVVIPVYGCRKALSELHRRLTETLSQLTQEYEIILVDDNCPQNSWESIEELCAADKKTKGIHMARNFGQASAITAGVDNCSGEWVVVMDCDLQDRPEHILNLYSKAKEGYDVVFARRRFRKDTALTMFLSRMFYHVLSYMTEEEIDPTIGNFSISRKKVIDNYCRMREHNRAYQLFIKWLGFRQTAIDLEGDERFEGKSSYSLKKKLHFAASLIVTHSNKPLKMSVKLGFLIFTISMIYTLVLIIQKLMGYNYLAGWTSILSSIYIMGGLLLAALGIIGIYIGNIFNEVKDRPIYVVTEMVNFDKEKQCEKD
ncbi:MAG: glycosyltransferase family 2 protein [Oscillospiraceae bacterium]|nr:glycosyltransferase family 2 protein [Oscillospiraceae bacterium]